MLRVTIIDGPAIGILPGRTYPNSRCPRIPLGFPKPGEDRRKKAWFYLTPSECYALADALREYAREAMQHPGAIDHEEGGDSAMPETDMIQPAVPFDPTPVAVAADPEPAPAPEPEPEKQPEPEPAPEPGPTPDPTPAPEPDPPAPDTE